MTSKCKFIRTEEKSLIAKLNQSLHWLTKHPDPSDHQELVCCVYKEQEASNARQHSAIDTPHLWNKLYY